MARENTTKKAVAKKTPVVAPATEKTWNKGTNLIVLPFTSKEMVENAILGWRKYFKGVMHIVTVGDAVIKSADDSLVLADTSLHSIVEAIEKNYPEVSEFILASDNIFCVNEFGRAEVEILKAESDPIDLLTGGILESKKLPTYNYSSNVPVVLNVKAIKEITARYAEGNIIALYFNTRFPKRIPCPLSMETDAFKCNITRPDANWSRLDEMFRAKIWFYVDGNGYQPQFVEKLKTRYSK